MGRRIGPHSPGNLMGTIHEHPSVMLLVAAFSRYPAALDWALTRCRERWGNPLDVSERFEFAETDYYTATMGSPLQKCFFVFPPAFNPQGLSDWKRETNAWEAEYAAQHGAAEPRPLNLDPGYLTLAKLVLASTKDHAHRVYLRAGVYAELTLCFRGGRWQNQPWTYPDYRRDDVQRFLLSCRERYKGHA